ncbi:hypothetical protein F2Q70_00013773 [Brassica cretica]|uniref:RWD domain-containing protein n=1 Tax=Brassica cretica TaxID=69181 RepID=A0A8S9M345_BRACR|nr:hypothetical protein F2Q70_00013773 [Brassica cretica]
MTEYKEEQEMEIEALESILADDFKEIHSSESGLNTSNRCFQITVTPQDDDLEESSSIPPVQLGLVFSHTENYPDEAPLLDVKSIRGIHVGDLTILKEKLEQEATENLGMAMMYTLVSSAEDWLSEHYGQDDGDDYAEEEAAKEDEVIVPHGEPVTLETFVAWRERYEAELALERANIRGIHVGDLTILKEKLEQEATENLGMAMMYTLVSSAEDWLSEHYGQDDGDDYAEEEAAKEDEVIVPHGEPVTLETFVAWRERYEAELALERAKLMPESALTAPKEKKLTGRQWFESGKARGTVVTADQESEEEDDEDIDFEDEDFEDDEEDMLEHYLAEKSDARA